MKFTKPFLTVACALALTVTAGLLGNSMAALGFAAILFFSLLLLDGGLVESRIVQVLAALAVSGVLAFESYARVTAPVPVNQPVLVFAAVVLAAVVEAWAFKTRASVMEASPVRELTVSLQAFVAILGVGLSAFGAPVGDALAGLAAAAVLAGQVVAAFRRPAPSRPSGAQNGRK